MTFDVGSPFTHLFATCISSLVQCLLRSLAHFLKKVALLLLNFKTFLCILDISVLSDESFANIFSQCVVYLLILLILSFMEQNF